MDIKTPNSTLSMSADPRSLIDDAVSLDSHIESEFAPARRLTWDDYRTLILSALGGALEYYDFVIFVFLAQPMAQLFFPTDVSDWLRQIQTFGVFAVGYLVRPLGGVFIAHLGDRLGRKRMFTVSILIMAAATLGTGLLPVYRQVGMWAPLGLILLRMVQGVAIGGEVSGAWVFVAEHAPANRLGLACGTLSAGISAGILLGSTITTVLASVFTSTEISNWAWRVPFLFGGILGLCSVYLRRLLQETPIFTELQAQKLLATELPVKVVVRDHGWSVVRSMLLTGFLSATIVVVLLMTPALLQKIDGLSMAVATRANSVAMLCVIIGCMVGGALADRLGAGRLLTVGSILLGISAWLFYTEGVTQPHFLLPLYASTGFLIGIAGGVHPYLMVRSFPASVRFSGLSFSYNVANAAVAGLTPLLISFLLPWVHFAPLYFVLAACAVGCAIGIVLWRREKSGVLASSVIERI